MAVRLEALYRRLRIPGVVDAHVHFMPPRIHEKVWRWFDEAPFHWPIRYRQDEEARRRALARFGVVRYTSLNYAHRPGMAEWLNAWTLELLDRDPRVIGTATFFPEEGVARYVDAALRDPRIRGFKLHAQVGRFDPDDPRLHPGYARAQEAGAVITLHVGSAPVPGEYTVPERFRAVVRRFPRLRFVVAHLGAYETDHYLDLAERYETIYFDTAMVFVDFATLGRFPDALLPRVEAARDRILFGSDFPNLPYPWSHQVEALQRLGFGDGWLRAVLYENAVKLYGLRG